MGTLVLTGATSGATTIQPTDAVTQTITLPNNSGTVLTNKSTGTILQVVQTVLTSAFTTTTQNTDITGLSVNITPSSSSNKILVLASVTWGTDANAPYSGLILNCNGTQILGDALGSAQRFTVGIGTPNGANPENATDCVNISYLHSPATTSSCTYKMQVGYIYGSRTVYINRNGVSTATSPQSQVGVSTITVMEVAV